MSPNSTTLHDYLQLMRVPNVFTAIADVSMGFLLVGGHATARGPLAAVIAASTCLYLAGMVWNDICDVEQDRRERPDRPLPAGRVSIRSARQLGTCLLALGVVSACLAPWLDLDHAPRLDDAGTWRCALIGLLLAANILLYDRSLKRTPAGPPAMGGCRFWNVLLGAAAGCPLAGPQSALPSFAWVAASGIGIYITGVTWLARREASESQPGQLAAATLTMALGVVSLGWLYHILPQPHGGVSITESTWWILLFLVTATVIRRCLIAVLNPHPTSVQRAVQHAIWSLILLDACIVLLAAPPTWSLAVLALLIPTAVLGTRFRST